MQKLISITLFVMLTYGSWCQFHENNIPKISSLTEAESYAARYSEVSFGIVNYEKDVFLFDNVDLSNPSASVGQINTLFHRRTKFLKDTTVKVVNVQVIEFSTSLSRDSIHNLMDQIRLDHTRGMSYWALMKKYHSSTCSFSSSPETSGDLKSTFGDDLTHRKTRDMVVVERKVQRGHPVVIIIEKEAHEVPAFYAISYNAAG